MYICKRTTHFLWIIIAMSMMLVFVPSQVSAATCACYYGGDNDCTEASVDSNATNAHCKVACDKAVGNAYKSHQFDDESFSFSGSVALDCVTAHATAVAAGTTTGPPTSAAGKPKEYSNKFVTPRLNIDIPGVKLTAPFEKDGYLHTNLLADYIEGVYKYLLSISVTLAVVMVMVGGLQYTFGGTSQQSISKAKERIKNGIVGIVLLISATLILQTVNPKLLDPDVLKIKIIQEEGMPEGVWKEFEKGWVGEVDALVGDFPTNNAIIQAHTAVKNNPPTINRKTTWSGRCNIYANYVVVKAGSKRNHNRIQSHPLIKDNAGKPAYRGLTLVELMKYSDKLEPGVIVHMASMWDGPYNNENFNHYFTYAGKTKAGKPQFVHSWGIVTPFKAQSFMDGWVKRDLKYKSNSPASKNVSAYFSGKTMPVHPSRIQGVYNPFMKK